MDQTEGTPEERAARGAALLDQFGHPNWRLEIQTVTSVRGCGCVAERALPGGFNQAMSLVGLMSRSRVSTFAYGFNAYDRQDDEAIVAAWKALASRSDASR